MDMVRKFPVEMAALIFVTLQYIIQFRNNYTRSDSFMVLHLQKFRRLFQKPALEKSLLKDTFDGRLDASS
jgi:hypothetical protein